MLVGAGLLLIAALIVTTEVLVRKAIPDLFDLIGALARLAGLDMSAATAAIKDWIREKVTFSGSDEVSGYLFAIGTTWSMAYVLVTRGHVRIDVLYAMLSPKARALLDILSLVVLGLFVGIMAERAFDVALSSLLDGDRSNTNLRVPLALVQMPWMAGIALFFVAAVLAFIKAVVAFVGGNYGGVTELIGASSQDEEIESELKGLGIETPKVEKV